MSYTSSRVVKTIVVSSVYTPVLPTSLFTFTFYRIYSSIHDSPMRNMSPVMLGNQENIPVLERGVKGLNPVRNLPPNVAGCSRGFLDFSLDRIQWNVSSYPGVTARVIWWGESYGEAATFK